MSATRLNPDVSGIIKAVNYSEPFATTNGNRSYTHDVPSGYTLLIGRPLGAFASGDPSVYITDRIVSQSGSRVTATFYVRNPNAARVAVSYVLVYVKTAFA